MAGQYQIHNDFLHGSCVDGLLASVCTLKWHDVSWQTLRLKCVIQRFEDIKKLSMSIVCKHSSELEKDVFLSCHKSGTRKNSESPWGIEPQTFGILSSDALPLSHRDSAVSEVYYEVHMTRVLHTTRISNVNSIMFVDRNKRDGKFWAQLRNRERCFFILSGGWDKEKFWVLMKNQTSHLWILHSGALPLSYRDSTESKVYYEVHVTCVLHAARISNVVSEMFVDRNKIEIFNQNCWKDILKINADSIQVW